MLNIKKYFKKFKIKLPKENYLKERRTREKDLIAKFAKVRLTWIMLINGIPHS